MGKIFDSDSRFSVVMGKAGDLILLNLLFLITSLPLVTIGASAAALHSVTLQMTENKESYIAKSYGKAFRLNFKSATAAWLIVLAVVFNFVLGYRLADAMLGERWGSLFRMVICLCGLMGMMAVSGSYLTAYGLAFLLLVGFALLAYMNSISFNKIFKKHMVQE